MKPADTQHPDPRPGDAGALHHEDDTSDLWRSELLQAQHPDPVQEALSRLTDAAEGAREFVDKVKTWEGSDPDEVHEVTQAIDDALVLANALADPPLGRQ